MNWIENNKRRPERSGIYTIQDTTGYESRVYFNGSRWLSVSGHPVVYWKESENPDMSDIEKLARHRKVKSDYAKLQAEKDRLEKSFEEIKKELTIYEEGNQDAGNTIVGVWDILDKIGLTEIK